MGNHLGDWSSLVNIRMSMARDILVEEEFGVMSTIAECLSDSAHAIWIGLRTLEKSAVSSEDIVHAVLRCSMEFCIGEI